MYGYISGLHAHSMWNLRALGRQKGGSIGIKPNPMIHEISDSMKIGYRHKVDNEAMILWHSMSIDKKLSSSTTPNFVSRWVAEGSLSTWS